jgi:hypothetical protein
VRLTHPSHMGILFKAISVVNSKRLEPVGF